MNIYRKMWYHHGNLTLAFKTMAGCHVILTATGQEGSKYLIYSIIKSKVIHSKDKMDMGNSLLFYYKFIIIIITLFYGPHARFCLMMQLVFFFQNLTTLLLTTNSLLLCTTKVLWIYMLQEYLFSNNSRRPPFPPLQGQIHVALRIVNFGRGFPNVME